MRKIFLPILTISILASCSAPKYAYHFDYYDYNAGKRKQAESTVVKPEVKFQENIVLHEETLIASANNEVIVLAEEVKKEEIVGEEASGVQKHYTEMTKAEKKEVRKEYKRDLKEYKEAKKSGDEVRAEQAKERLTGYTRIGVILIIAGLILAILSLGSLINSIGGLMVLAGLIFILIDII